MEFPCSDLIAPQHLDGALYVTTPKAWLGQVVLGIETGGDSIDVLIYVASAGGRRVRAGMPALVSPVTVRAVESGSLTGVVESISEFPVSLDGMTAPLQNEDLARTFSADGLPYSGRVALTPDASTASGFAWTSPRGAAWSARSPDRRASNTTAPTSAGRAGSRGRSASPFLPRTESASGKSSATGRSRT